MDELTQIASSYERRMKVLEKIFELINSNKQKGIHWKQVYKNLLLIEHMAINADDACV